MFTWRKTSSADEKTLVSSTLVIRMSLSSFIVWFTTDLIRAVNLVIARNRDLVFVFCFAFCSFLNQN